MRVCGELLLAKEPLLPVATELLLPVITSLEDVIDVAVVVDSDNVELDGAWQSSSMQAKIVFWWKSSLIPIFCEQEKPSIVSRSLAMVDEQRFSHLRRLS